MTQKLTMVGGTLVIRDLAMQILLGTVPVAVIGVSAGFTEVHTFGFGRLYRWRDTTNRAWGAQKAIKCTVTE